jgi:3'-phosphoadenosine 5'-phosphosulfate sulfotransferase (PAPS reductase)/FAD synthetase
LEKWQLQQLQGLPLEVKIEKTKLRIKEWYEYWNGQVYISFSGGKDSTVLLHIVRELYPDVPAVFVDTGLEYPEIKEFVKTIDNVVWLKPKMSFKKVIETYGYPVVSKRQSQYIRQCRTTSSEYLRDLRLYGTEKGTAGKISEKWKPLLDAPFKVSEQCCEIMKKKPFKKYDKETGRKPFIGTMATESLFRKQHWLKNGCNAFNKNNPSSQPMSFWTEQDVLSYIYNCKVPYTSIYGDIVKDDDGTYINTGEQRTGCMFCMYGCHMEKEPNRFQRMKITHPKIYDYCIRPIEQGGLGLGKVLDYINVKY